MKTHGGCDMSTKSANLEAKRQVEHGRARILRHVHELHGHDRARRHHQLPLGHPRRLIGVLFDDD
eukprot:8150-Eustigmatos_ZCMA.PRE.1